MCTAIDLEKIRHFLNAAGKRTAHRRKREVIRPLVAEHCPQTSGSSDGFTLLEVLVALTLFGVVLAAALPNLTEMKASFDRSNASKILEYDLRRARSEALSKGVRIIITLAADGRSYTVGEDMLAYDTSNGNYDSLLFTRELPQNITLSFSGSDANATKLIFSSRGFLSDIAGNRTTAQRVATLSYQGSSFATATLYPIGVASVSH